MVTLTGHQAFSHCRFGATRIGSALDSLFQPPMEAINSRCLPQSNGMIVLCRVSRDSARSILPLSADSMITGASKVKRSAVLRRLYRPGFAYAKAGVMLTEIISASQRMPTLFDDSVGMARSKNLMHAVDSINQAYGRGTIRLAAEGIDQHWKMRAGRRSPAFTTCLAEIPIARAI